MTFRISQMSVARQVGTVIAVLVVAIAIIAAYGLYNLRQVTGMVVALEKGVQVNGPIYKSIIYGKDAVADVLPPPLYIIESYLTACQLSDVDDPARIEELQATMTRLRTEFEDRRQY